MYGFLKCCCCTKSKLSGAVVQAGPSRDAGDDKKSRVSRKHVIVGVTCAVVIAMVITGVLVGVKFFLDSTNDIVKVTFRLSVVAFKVGLHGLLTGAHASKLPVKLHN